MKNKKASINDAERPSEDEIETLCLAIRSQWTEQQKDDRRCAQKGDAAGWSVPQFVVHHSESVTYGKGRTIVYRRID